MAFEKIQRLVLVVKDKIIPRSNVSPKNRLVNAYMYDYDGSRVSPNNRLINANLGNYSQTSEAPRIEIEDIIKK